MRSGRSLVSFSASAALFAEQLNEPANQAASGQGEHGGHIFSYKITGMQAIVHSSSFSAEGK